MKEKIEQLKSQIADELNGEKGREAFKTIREKYLSKKAGEIPRLMTELKNVSADERPKLGKLINEFKGWAEKRFDEAEEVIKKDELAKKNAGEAVDILCLP